MNSNKLMIVLGFLGFVYLVCLLWISEDYFLMNLHSQVVLQSTVLVINYFFKNVNIDSTELVFMLWI